ncbi:MAG TPA: hypothetical protein VD794_11770 [Flavisolibacter sp.]|nr:hypothetical protein [Flavisolibacter sp.]
MENQNNNGSSSNNKTNDLLSSILGNALASSQKFETAGSGVETRKCSSCGAARPEGTDLSTCDYCGFEFFKKNG